MDTPDQNQSRPRIYYLDNIRFLACCLVILTHSVMPPAPGAATSFWYSFYSLICCPASDLFFAISGAVMLPIRMDVSSFFKKRFSKVLFPLIFWSIFYVCVNGLPGMEKVDPLWAFILMPIYPVIGIFWFMYVLCGLYLFAPIISCWIRVAGKKQFIFFLSLWAITLCLPLINIYKEGVYLPAGSYFSLNSFGGFLGYMILGVFLVKYPLKLKPQVILALIALMYFLLFAANRLLDIIPTSFIVDRLSIFQAVLVCLIFSFVQKIKLPDSLQRMSTNFAKYSFGVYLVHIVVVRAGLWEIFKRLDLPVGISTPLIAAIGLVLCYYIVRGIALLPKSKYIIGV